MYRLLDIDCGESYLVRCFCPESLVMGKGDRCIFRSGDMMEAGVVYGVIESQEEPDASTSRLPVALRRATLQDQSQLSENILFKKSVRRLCEEKIQEHKLSMSLVRLRCSLDRSRLIVEFTSEEKIDFRALVQALSTETKARVDMRQIGVRDAAAIVGGMGPCGRRLCCSGWLKEFENVNIRMAKIQGLSLGPMAINGMCGRLKCCLRFEHNCYRDLARLMPRVGKRVRCPEGEGKVIATHLLTQKVRVLMDDGGVLLFDANDII